MDSTIDSRSLNGVSPADVTTFREAWYRLAAAETERESAHQAFGTIYAATLASEAATGRRRRPEGSVTPCVDRVAGPDILSIASDVESSRSTMTWSSTTP